MILRKIEYKLSAYIGPIARKIKGLDINWGYFTFTVICLVSIVVLGSNVFRTINKGYERFEIIQSERERLEKLIERNVQLKEDLKYYSSTEYIDLKAREELNLAFPNQRLVYVEHHGDIEIEQVNIEEQTELEPDWRHWYNLVMN